MFAPSDREKKNHQLNGLHIQAFGIDIYRLGTHDALLFGLLGSTAAAKPNV